MPYLTPVVPFRIDRAVNGLRSELLSTHRYNSIWVRFPLAEHRNILLHEVFSLNHVDAQDALQ